MAYLFCGCAIEKGEEMEYKLKTDIYEDSIICQTLYAEIQPVHTKIMQDIVNLRDEQVKEALIKLGWTPPNKEQKPIEDNK